MIKWPVWLLIIRTMSSNVHTSDAILRHDSCSSFQQLDCTMSSILLSLYACITCTESHKGSIILMTSEKDQSNAVELRFFHILVWHGLKSMYLCMKQIYLIQMWMYTSLSFPPLWCCHVTLRPLLQGFAVVNRMLSIAIESCHCNPSTPRNEGHRKTGFLPSTLPNTSMNSTNPWIHS